MVTYIEDKGVNQKGMNRSRFTARPRHEFNMQATCLLKVFTNPVYFGAVQASAKSDNSYHVSSTANIICSYAAQSLTMSNHNELPPASSAAGVPTPFQLLGKMPAQPLAELSSQPLPSLKLSVSLPMSLSESAPDVRNGNRDTGMAGSQSMLEMPLPFSHWKRNCYTLFEVDEKESSPKVMTATAHMEATSGISCTDHAMMLLYQELTVSPFHWKYQGYRNISAEFTGSRDETIGINKFLSKTRGQMICTEINASVASTTSESGHGIIRAKSSTDLRGHGDESASFGLKRNLSASDLKALVSSLFNVSPNASGGNSKSVPASPMSSPESQRKSIGSFWESELKKLKKSIFLFIKQLKLSLKASLEILTAAEMIIIHLSRVT